MPKKRAVVLKAKLNFYQVPSFPSMISFIDGSHIPIIAISHVFAYVNQKKFCSISIQGICHANLIFSDLVANWLGSNQNSFVLFTSSIPDEFEKGKFGDS